MSAIDTRIAVDAAIARLAGSQHGAFSRAQALGLGASSRTIARRLAEGRWIARHSGVYLIAGAPATWMSEITAALLARPGSVVSHEAAGVLHRMRYVERGVVSISDDRPRSPDLIGVAVHRPRRLDRARIVQIDDLPVTDRPSTVVDLAGVMRVGRFTQVVDDQLSSHRLELPELIHAFEFQARRGRKGIAMMRSLLESRVAGVAATRSELEALFRRLVLPHIEATFTFEFLPPWRDDGIGRADCAFPAHRLIAELDGRRWHLRDEDFEADRRRDQEALERNWRTVRYTHRQITQETLRVIANLRKILELGGS